MPTQIFQQNSELEVRCSWLVIGYLLVLLVIWLSLAPSPIELPITEGDKFSHLFAYFVLMSWFSNLYRGFVPRLGFAIGFIILGVSLEYIQQWTGFRHFEFWDMMASVTGVVLGWALAPPRLPNYLQVIERAYRLRIKL